MESRKFDFGAYLGRIGLERPGADATGLRGLQEAHMRSIAFENFDPLLGNVPALGLGELFDKIVRRGRGGYCFEQNGLFEAALNAAGFATRRMLARVRMRFGPEGARSHLVLRVDIGSEAWLADAGFGGPGPLHPLRLDVAGEQEMPNGAYRLVADEARGETVVERRESEGWMQLYAFDGARVSDGEIASANHFCATWDQVPFAAHLLAGAWCGERRYGLFDRALTVSGPDGEEQRELVSIGDFAALVTGEMGIALESAALERAWEKIGG